MAKDLQWVKTETDKGYINQSAVLSNRAGNVDTLYGDPPPAGVIVVEAN